MARIKTGLVERSALLRRRRDEISLMNNPKADSDELPQWVEGGSTTNLLGDRQPSAKSGNSSQGTGRREAGARGLR
jgi:hypothetical protein